MLERNYHPEGRRGVRSGARFDALKRCWIWDFSKMGALFS
jgi:hypothetical protein